MKEYIDKILYNASGLTVGLTENKHSVIFAQNNEAVVLDVDQVGKVVKHLSSNKLFGEFDGFSFSLKPKGILLNQYDHSVYVDRDVFKQLTSK